MVNVDLLSPDDWQELRVARLAALRDAPHAFTGTFDSEILRSPGEWVARILSSTWAGARDHGELVGIACLTAASRAEPRQQFIESVWVSPAQRRQGLTRAMLQRLELRAFVDCADRLQLWVLDGNDAAFDAYLKLGFAPVLGRDQDSSVQRADGSFVRERLMERQIRNS